QAELRRFAKTRKGAIAGGAIGCELGERRLRLGTLALVGEHARRFVGGPGFGSLTLFPVNISAPGTDAGQNDEGDGNDVVAVALPQLLQAFASYFLVDFLENVGHEPNSRAIGERPRNPTAGQCGVKLAMWRAQGKAWACS